VLDKAAQIVVANRRKLLDQQQGRQDELEALDGSTYQQWLHETG
jgi:hypothetical protein